MPAFIGKFKVLILIRFECFLENYVGYFTQKIVSKTARAYLTTAYTWKWNFNPENFRRRQSSDLYSSEFG